MLRPMIGEGWQRQRLVWLTGIGLGSALAIGALALGLQQAWRDHVTDNASPALKAQAPAPPAQELWHSPLRRQCHVADNALQHRLQLIWQNLPQRTQRLRIHPSNYGQRMARDAYGQAISDRPQMVVLHETVYGLNSAINTFMTNHPNDADQVSYHMLIGEKGQIVQALDPARRAFGAGYSAFKGKWAVTNPSMAGSVNNFALHLSLETPLDGENEAASHSGYTTAQYDAMAVVLADWMRRYGIPPENITTHRHVDLGLERADPRSFNWQALQVRLAALGLLC